MIIIHFRDKFKQQKIHFSHTEPVDLMSTILDGQKPENIDLRMGIL